MATYLELRNFYHDSDTINKVEAAVAAIMNDIVNEDDTAANGYDDVIANHTDRLKWTIAELGNVRAEAEKIAWPVMMIHKDDTVATIEALTVTTIISDIKGFIVEYCRGTQL